MAADRESRIREHGEAIFRGMAQAAPSVFRKDFWSGKLLDWAMGDEQFKTQLFRFVDVFPVLRTPEAIARHLQEYFGDEGIETPAWMQLGLKAAGGGGLIARTAIAQVEKNIRGMAHTFVAGETPAEALPKLETMRRQQLGFTVDLLGEATVSAAEALEYQRRYLDLVDQLCTAAATWKPVPAIDEDDRGPIPRVNVSIKISALYSQIDPVDFSGSVDALVERLLPILRLARERGAFCNLDMEQYELKDLTLALFRRLLDQPELAGWDDLGLVLQAYLRDSLDDARTVVEWARATGRRFTVRLVKGAYWDYETVTAQQHGWPIPVYCNKPETDANYEAIADLLLAEHVYLRAAIASHNVRTIAAALASAEDHRVPDGGFEVQTLYGMAEPLRPALLPRGIRMREYVPIGELLPGMAYLVRRLLENTSNEGFLRAKFRDEADPAALLRPPLDGLVAAPDPQPDSLFRNEPHRDFARADVREAFAAALAAVGGQLGQDYPLLINGIARAGDEWADSTDSAAPEVVVGRVAQASRQDALDALAAAKAAFGVWRDRPAGERADLIRGVAQAMRTRRDELSAWMVREVGKNWREADADVAEAIDFCDYYAAEAERLMAEPHRLGRWPGELDHLFYQPLGPGVVIAPWNFPLAILCGMTVAALVCGNTVVIKPAGPSPVIAAKFVDCCAGLPPGVLNYLPGRGSVIGDLLVEHPDTRFIAFTGSREVGLRILRKAFDTSLEQPGVRRVICEMGGKNAIIIDSDADLDVAVEAVIYSAFGYQGQKCSACSRAIVLDDCYDAFVPRLVEAARSLPIGPPTDPAFAYGPVVTAEAAEGIRQYIDLGAGEGTVLLRRDDLPSDGHYLPFTIIADIEPHHRLAQEEVFGPVLAVMRARDFDHALELANGTQYALTGAVISRSPVNLARARREFRVGNLYLNRGCTGALVYRQPFGGFKYSGTGIKAGGPNYLHQFVEERSCSENTVRRGFAPEE